MMNYKTKVVTPVKEDSPFLERIAELQKRLAELLNRLATMEKGKDEETDS